ncbi:aldehyde dehydrogenase (NADP(+)) [Mariniblastus fucicola]|uniref:NADP-dependent fatty aldehyde dehydrogenase n=1 Tax=Mariniblastus fucicola TaxID=980251 RepID=A0A5B9P5V9_9BACT|nr:aldehyde dehydrogenase (NADP(+)) [Mariniblastus fucicola]QEG20310.1 NADP-dependent fatty aldehyde dehydrogenase [Mariniblastus fucicola]
MTLTGQHFIAGERSATGSSTFTGVDPSTGDDLPTSFHDATSAEVDAAVNSATEAFYELQKLSGEKLATFIELIATKIEEAGDTLLDRAHAETALPMGRLQGERGRTCNQTRIFASMARDGQWRQARIDVGDPGRTPPKPDVRTLLYGVGPVAVFGASNFPLAIGAVGTDTICAFAAGCPVVVKAHPAHPGTCEILGSIVTAAVKECGLPAGTFSLLQSNTNESSAEFVRHPGICAVAFTGSLKGGRALYDIACSRPNPIPLYAEMGSLNPVFLLPGALAERSDSIAEGYIQSVTMGVGQFCTNPSVVLGMEGDTLESFISKASDAASNYAPQTMLHPGIHKAYESGRQKLGETAGVTQVGISASAADENANEAACAIYSADFSVLDSTSDDLEEIFGPTSTVYKCQSLEQMVKFAKGLDGHLTATIHGTEQDLLDHAELVNILQHKVGRIVFNGFPTGIEVCNAMHHGGPYPAATHSFFTSIGHHSIYRFAKPVCFQGFPAAALPEPLRS